jgi:hypothetical protein
VFLEHGLHRATFFPLTYEAGHQLTVEEEELPGLVVVTEAVLALEEVAEGQLVPGVEVGVHADAVAPEEVEAEVDREIFAAAVQHINHHHHHHLMSQQVVAVVSEVLTEA